MAASGRETTHLDMDSSVEIEGDLDFQDIVHTKGTSDKGETHVFKNFPSSQIDDSDDDGNGDKDQLLKTEKKANHSFWTFEYYQQFFDVDTQQVAVRILGSMLPNPRKNFLQSYIRPSPDLYGPFWICTTLIFTIAVAGNVANYIQVQGDYQWVYDFHKVTLSAATIYCYWWLVPALVWGLLLWRRSRAGITFLEILCLYGYSLSIFIPVSILWVIQVSWLQWLLVLLGMLLSGTVIVITLWPAVCEDDKKVALSVMALVILLHGLLAVGFMLYFFHVPSASESTILTSPGPSTEAPSISTVPAKHS